MEPNVKLPPLPNREFNTFSPKARVLKEESNLPSVQASSKEYSDLVKEM